MPQVAEEEAVEQMHAQRDFMVPERSVAVSDRGMVATSHPAATLAGLDILRAGGNAIDAAIAAVAIHSVIDPALIIMGGSIGARIELKVALERHLSRCMADPVPLEISSLGSRATLVGAVGTALTHLHRSLFGIIPLGEPTSGSLNRPVSDKDVAA